MSEIEDLKKELQALKDQLNPPPRQPSTHLRRDLTEGASHAPICNAGHDRCRS